MRESLDLTATELSVQVIRRAIYGLPAGNVHS